jgi:hypothetical protein
MELPHRGRRRQNEIRVQMNDLIFLFPLALVIVVWAVLYFLKDKKVPPL